MLEWVRKRLRSLVPLVERTKKTIISTNFADEQGTGVEIELPGTGGTLESTEFAQFRKKAQHFLKEHLAEVAIAKVRSDELLSKADIAELQRILVTAGIGDDNTFEQASQRAGSFGSFVRSLVGLDRAAAKAAFAEFLDDKRYAGVGAAKTGSPGPMPRAVRWVGRRQMRSTVPDTVKPAWAEQRAPMWWAS